MAGITCRATVPRMNVLSQRSVCAQNGTLDTSVNTKYVQLMTTPKVGQLQI